MNNLSGDTAGLKLYAYGADGKLAEVSKELWSITDEARRLAWIPWPTAHCMSCVSASQTAVRST